MSIKKYLSLRVMILIVFLVFSLIAIGPKISTTGALVKSVQGDIEQNIGLYPNMIILSVNDQPVTNVEDYTKIMSDINVEPKEIIVLTTEGSYNYEVLDDIGFDLVNLTVTNSRDFANVEGDLISIEGKEVTINNVNTIINEILPRQIIRIQTNKGEYSYLSTKKPQLTVTDIPSNNIKKGLELEGGTRVLLKPVSDTAVTDKGVSDVIKVLTNRLNIYGLSDLKIRSSKDLEGTKYILIEIAGVSREEVKSKVAEQGKFEAKIGDEVVFEGGKNDIPFVCRDDGGCSGIRSCNRVEDDYQCRFAFAIHLSQEAAGKHAEITKDLDVNITEHGEYLSKTIDFYLDGEKVDSLNIGADLKGKATTQVEISGPGLGSTEQIAYENAVENMDKLQTVLITGSLPYTLEIIKLDYISPVLGKAFVKNIILTMFAAILAVLIVVYARYRIFKVAIPIVITMLSELFITLGVAALIKWNLDIASIAGLIAVVGTGVDSQIIITDEIIKGAESIFNWKEKIKRAFFVIFTAYATLFVAMIPLWYAGAGLLRGFAVTTLIGVSIGVFITRPAFASIMEQLLKKE